MGRSGSQHGRLFFLPAATFRCGGRCEQATSRQARSGATDKRVPLNLGMRLRSDYLVVTSHQHISVGITITAANHTRRSPMALSPLVSLRTHLQEQPPWSIASHEACTNNRCTSPSGQQMLSGTLDGKGPLALNGEKGRRASGAEVNGDSAPKVKYLCLLLGESSESDPQISPHPQHLASSERTFTDHGTSSRWSS